MPNDRVYLPILNVSIVCELLSQMYFWENGLSTLNKTLVLVILIEYVYVKCRLLKQAYRVEDKILGMSWGGLWMNFSFFRVLFGYFSYPEEHTSNDLSSYD